jgi:PhnB protein
MKIGDTAMKIRPYLTYNGTCAEAIELYKRAFKADTLQVMRFSDMPPNPNFQIPDEYRDRILQATMQFGDDYIRLSDCGPGQPLNDPESERISLAVETTVDAVQYAFAVLAEEGRVGMPLAETFYSPCAGVVFDKFGVMWNFVAQK